MSSQFTNHLFFHSSLVQSCGHGWSEWMVCVIAQQSCLFCHILDCVSQLVDSNWQILEPNISFIEHFLWSQIQSRTFPLQREMTIVLIEDVYWTSLCVLQIGINHNLFGLDFLMLQSTFVCLLTKVLCVHQMSDSIRKCVVKLTAKPKWSQISVLYSSSKCALNSQNKK